MKPDILFLCILATILGRTQIVIGFLSSHSGTPTSRTTASAASMHPHQQKQQQVLRPPSYAEADYLNALGSGNVAFQAQSIPLDSHERAVYDPGDELLRSLIAERTTDGQELVTLPEEPDYADTVHNELEVANKYEMLKKLGDELREEQEMVDKSTLLMRMLEDPSIETLPIVYVEDAPVGDYNDVDYGAVDNGISKRSRYYRRYSWKRHNRNRGNYEPELRYPCTPSKEDVFKLLLNLHENRKGNHSKTVNFCNRKRPAKAVFTNIRFLG